MVSVELTRWPTANRGAARPGRRSARRHRRPGRRHRNHHQEARHPRRALAGGHRRSRCASARRSPQSDIRGRTDFRDLVDRHDRRRARARFRRCDHDREAAERQLLARRAHRRCVALRQEGSALDREAYERGTSVYFPERAVHMFPSELATGLCSLNPHVDRLVQSCLMEVNRTRRSRASRIPRRRHQQQRADDLHRRQRHPDRPRSRTARSAMRRSCRCSN